MNLQELTRHFEVVYKEALHLRTHYCLIIQHTNPAYHFAQLKAGNVSAIKDNVQQRGSRVVVQKPVNLLFPLSC